MKGYSLIDANSFYASCEQVFRPDLREKPVVVLSNNDGCIIARSALAKKLGIKMGIPYFKIKDFLEQSGVVVFSSNYALYADLSNRLHNLIRSLAPTIEVYSIDECFTTTDGLKDLEQLGLEWRKTILKATGITCGIGFAPTKTLAKLANHAAKQWPQSKGVVDLSNPIRQQKLLKLMPVTEVWGVGHRLAKHLAAYKIYTAADLAAYDPKWIRRKFSVVLEKTVRELNGISCLAIEEVAPVKQQIVASRSFGQPVTTKQSLSEAIAEYTARAAEKLRHEGQWCQMITPFVCSSPFNDQAYYSNSKVINLTAPTCDTRDLIKAALSSISELFQEGVRYKKAGVLLSDFVNPRHYQQTLFGTPNIRNDEALMRAVDRINQRERGGIYLASQGIERPWSMQRGKLSPAYTTRWKDVPIVR